MLPLATEQDDVCRLFEAYLTAVCVCTPIMDRIAFQLGVCAACAAMQGTCIAKDDIAKRI